MKELIDILHRENCSLVVRDVHGEITIYRKPGVRDLEDLLRSDTDRLRGADIADKVIGKAAAGMAVYGGVHSVYGEVLSRQALPILNEAGVGYSYGTLVDVIVREEGDKRCPLEQIVAKCRTPYEIVETLYHHWYQK